MKLELYSPSFRQVLLKEITENVTKGGLYIPSSVPLDEKEYLVMKVGRDCIEIKPGDKIRLSRGIQPEPVDEYFQVMEMQIKGYERNPE
jgi:co-chaperonin GroES (HSP10)